LAGLRHALVEVVQHGTAAAARFADLQIAGKTGTAQNPPLPAHGWFIGFAPADSPRVVVGAIIEFAGHSTAAVYLVDQIIARYLLGPTAAPLRVADFQPVVPEDSAPASVPILPDTGRVTAIPPDTGQVMNPPDTGRVLRHERPRSR